MHKYLPSKKFIVIFLAIVGALIIILISFLALQRKNTTVIQEKEQIIQKKQVEFLALDTDNDNLRDWEETLWKTDPKNPDSDQDGTNDGDEIKENRNPLKANTSKGISPNDSVPQEIIESQKKSEEEFSRLTQTEKLARIILSQYIASKDSGSLSETYKQMILDTAASVIDEGKQTSIPLYKMSDLNVLTSSDTTSLKKYANNMADAVTYKGTISIQQELSVLADAIDEDNPNILNKLDNNISFYKIIINSILKTPVPKELAQNHLIILNSFVVIKKDVENMKSLFSDTVKAIGALEEYKKIGSDLPNLYLNIGRFLIANNILLTNKESGYIFINNVK